MLLRGKKMSPEGRRIFLVVILHCKKTEGFIFANAARRIYFSARKKTIGEWSAERIPGHLVALPHRSQSSVFSLSYRATVRPRVDIYD